MQRPNDDDPFLAFFSRLVREAAEAVLSEVRVHKRRPGSDERRRSSSQVAFCGAAISGSFFVVVDHAELDDEIVADDWVAEIANRIAGRVGNRLAALGMPFQVRPPVALDDDELAVHEPSRHVRFEHEASGVSYRVDAHVDTLEAVRTYIATTEDLPVEEGTLLLF